MSEKSIQQGSESQRTVLQLEPLESRLVPSTYLSNGDVVIIGDKSGWGGDVADFVMVERVTGALRITQNGVVSTFQSVPGGDIVFYGQGGNDIFYNLTSLRSTAYGGLGDDILIGSSNADHLHGNDGNDTLSGQGGQDALTGDGGNDVVSGGGGTDQIDGNAGNDRLYGEGGLDYVGGGSGNDTVDGGAGQDYLWGDDGADELWGGFDTNYNYLDGGNGNDDLHGGYGPDDLLGSNGDDLLVGYTGNDQLFGEGGRDVLTGNEGDDTLHSGGDDDEWDVMVGGAGADQFTREGYIDDSFGWDYTPIHAEISDFTFGQDSEILFG
jgi:Ca2+-binding RTX toxin-like protein